MTLKYIVVYRPQIQQNTQFRCMKPFGVDSKGNRQNKKSKYDEIFKCYVTSVNNIREIGPGGH